jgi:hypothetical protein
MKTQFIKTNLFIVHNDNGQKFIQSYETIVAEIIGNEIICYGKYSNTTTRHIKHIAQIMDKTIVESDQKPYFKKFEYGVKIK